MMDLLQESRKRTRTLCLGCGCAVVGALVWAVIPLSMPQIEAPSLETASAVPEKRLLAALDVKVFDTPVWTIAAAPAPPPTAAPPHPPPPPLKLQLIGILIADRGYKAVLYEPDTSKLFVVTNGQQAQGHTIDRVSQDGVTVRDGLVVRMLGLKSADGVGGGR